VQDLRQSGRGSPGFNFDSNVELTRWHLRAFFELSEKWRVAKMMTLEQDIAPKTIPCHPNAGLLAEAEKELSAFLSAVTAVHGQQHVMPAAKHWMQALEDVCPPTFASRECFRKVTRAAAVSLTH
jgi:hypothetical protein